MVDYHTEYGWLRYHIQDSNLVHGNLPFCCIATMSVNYQARAREKILRTLNYCNLPHDGRGTCKKCVIYSKLPFFTHQS